MSASQTLAFLWTLYFMFRFILSDTRESALRAFHPASQDIRSLMSPENQMSAPQTLAFLWTLHFMFRFILTDTREFALRAFHPASQDIRSLMSPENQMSASQPLAFLWTHYILTQNRGFHTTEIIRPDRKKGSAVIRLL